MKKKDFSTVFNIIRNWSSYITGFPRPVPVGYVIIGVTLSCNARCKMCNIHTLYKKNPDLVNSELDLSLMSERLRESKIIAKISHIDLTGGEPFLKENIDDFIVSLFDLPNINLITINTNGLLSGRIINKIGSILKVLRRDKYFSVSISMDGIGEIHDKIRGIAGAFGKVETTLAGLEELRGKYPNFTIRSNAVIQPENIQYSGELKKYWSMHDIAGAFSIIQTPFYTLCQDAAYGADRFSRDDIRKIKSIEPKSKGMNYYLDNNFKRPLHCFAGYASLFIDPFGYVYPCNFLGANEDYRMGNIKDSTIDKVWTSRLASDVRVKVKACPYLTCWNGCEVDQTMIQFEPVDRLVRAISFGLMSYYKIKRLNNFR